MTISSKTKIAVHIHCDHLMEKDNVIGVMAGEETSGGKKTGREAVICLVTKKIPKDQLISADLVPHEVHDEDGNPVPTDVIEVGEIVALHMKRHRPVVPGTSVGHFEITAGTLGLVVHKNGASHILSNNHVLANTNSANIGDPVYQPGPTDGGRIEDTVAHLSHFVPINFSGDNLVDAALAKLIEAPNNPPVEESPTDETPTEKPPVNIPPPPAPKKKDFLERLFAWFENLIRKLLGRDKKSQDVNSLAVKEGVEFDNAIWNLGRSTGQLGAVDVGDAVQKSGRTTGYTKDKVIGINAVVSVSYGTFGNARFIDQIICGPMSKGGDSGSAVLDEDGNMVGLLFAGSDTITIINRVSNVFEALDIERIS